MDFGRSGFSGMGERLQAQGHCASGQQGLEAG
jgi:hypothetical protein